MKNGLTWMLAAILACGTTVFTACSSNEENAEIKAAYSYAKASTSLLIYCRTEGELITLKYYDTVEKKLYTIRDIANL